MIWRPTAILIDAVPRYTAKSIAAIPTMRRGRPRFIGDLTSSGGGFMCRGEMMPNDTDHRPGAPDARHETEALLPGSVHPFCWAGVRCSVSFHTWLGGGSETSFLEGFRDVPTYVLVPHLLEQI